MSKRQLVVIGNGMAGARTVEEILQRGGGDRFEITVFGEEPYGNYNRILLSDVLNGSQDPSDIFLHSMEWYQQNNIRLRAGARVTSIDRERKQVYAESGESVSFDKLLIATGSRPFIPPVEGMLRPGGKNKRGLFVFRTIDDCRAILSYAQTLRYKARQGGSSRPKVAVVGGGLLGLEAARGLLQHGMEVHVIHRASHLMNHQLDPMAGNVLKETMEGLGVKVRLDTSTEEILGEERVEGIAFLDGEMLHCDMVIMACGIRPNIELAKGCGLAADRGIVVDDRMRSVSDPDVYAVGECAQHRGRVYGMVAPLWEQAKVLADHVTGRNRNAEYEGSKTIAKLKVMGVELASMGVTEPQDDHDELVQFFEPRRGIYKKLIIRNGKLVGAMLLGDGDRAAYLMQVFDRGGLLPENRSALLFDLGGGGPTASAKDLPGDAQVCNCNGVSKAAIEQSVMDGQCSVQAVMKCTRAGTGCGSCRPMVKELVESAMESASGIGYSSLPKGEMPLRLEYNRSAWPVTP